MEILMVVVTAVWWDVLSECLKVDSLDTSMVALMGAW